MPVNLGVQVGQDTGEVTETEDTSPAEDDTVGLGVKVGQNTEPQQELAPREPREPTRQEPQPLGGDDTVDLGVNIGESQAEQEKEEDQDTIDLGISMDTADVIEEQEIDTSDDFSFKIDEGGEGGSDIGRVTSFFGTLARSGFEGGVERPLKWLSSALTSMGGGGYRSRIQKRLEEAQAIANEEGISFEEAADKVKMGNDTLFGMFKGPTQEAIESGPLWQLADMAGKAVDEIAPQNEEFQDEIITGWTPRVLGELGALFSAGALAGSGKFAMKSLSRKAQQRLASGAVGASSQGVAAYERAKAEGASDQEAYQNFLANTAIGSLEGLPVARAFKRFDEFVEGGVKSGLAETGVNTVKGFFEESVQEGLAQTMQNLATDQIYDETQELFEDVGTSMAVGGVLGGTINAIGTGLNRRIQQADTRQEAAEAAETKDWLKDQLDNDQFDSPATPEQLDQEALPPPGSKDYDTADPDDIGPDNQTLSYFENESLRRIEQKMRNWMSPRGFGKGVVPESVNKAFDAKEGKIRKELNVMKQNTRELSETLNNEYGPEGTLENVKSFFSSGKAADVPEEIYTELNDFLQGQSLGDNLPKDVRVAARKMRAHVDRLSNRLIEEGAAEGPVKAKIKENLGAYLTRSYRKHDFDDWENYLLSDDEGKRIFRRAVGFIEQKFRRQGKTPEDAVGKSAENIARELMDSDAAPIDVFKQSSEVAEGIDWGVFMKRGEIAPEIRALMGEYEDAAVNYVKSIEKISHLLETRNFQQRVKEIGLDQGWLYDPRSSDVPERAKKITSDNSDAFEPLTNEDGNAYWAEPEIADAFNSQTRDLSSNGLYDLYVRANGAAKASVTILNPTTWIKNGLGGVYMMTANGHNPLSSDMAESFRAVRKNLTGEGPDPGTFSIERADELGLFGGGGRSGEAMDLLKDIEGTDGKSFVDQIIPGRNSDRSTYMAPFRVVRRGIEKAGETYQAIDEVFRLAFWRQEIADHADAFYDKPYSELDADQRARVEEVAAQKTKSNYQDYSQVPKIIRAMRRAPLSNFASFTSEMLRTSFNTYKTAWNEMRSSNPKLNKMGRRRLMAALAHHTGFISKALATTGGMMAGASMSEDEEEDLRNFMPAWDEDGIIMPVGKEERPGRAPKFSYYNISQADPFAIWGDGFQAALRGEDPADVADKMGSAAYEHFSNFVEPALLIEKILQLSDNEDEFGGQVYQPSANTGKQVAQMAAHFYDLYEPGALQGAREAYNALTVNGDESEAENNAMLGALGFRVGQVDPERSMTFEGLEFQKGVRQDRKLFNQAKFEGDTDEMADAMAQANQSYRERFEEMRSKVLSAYRLGMSFDQIKDKLVNAGVAKSRAEDLIGGVPSQLITPEDWQVEE